MSDVFITWLKNIDYGDRARQTLIDILEKNAFSILQNEDIEAMYNASKVNSERFFEEIQSLYIKALEYSGIGEEEIEERIHELEQEGYKFHPNIEQEIANDANIKMSSEAVDYILSIVNKKDMSQSSTGHI